MRYFSSLYLLLFFAFVLPDSLWAQSKLDLSLLQQLRRSEAHFANRRDGGVQTVSVMAVLNPKSHLPQKELVEMGVSIGAQVGRVVSLRIPISQLLSVAELTSIERITSNHRYQLTCFNTRVETGVDQLHEATWQSSPSIMSYTGKGVLLGMIDTGIEYNHLNFRDPNTGETRLKGALLYRPEKGAADSIREYYTLPEQIDTLTTDNPNNAHGTHTSGVAAGSYLGLNMQGMAPDADLMLCGTRVLEEDRIIDAMQQAFARADELGEPCVINLSIGNPIGWKDGLSPLNLVCDALTDGGEAPGRVIVFSAGNDGAKSYVAHHTFQDSQPVYALLQPAVKYGQELYLNPNIDLYCSDSLPLQLDYQLYDTLQHEFLDLPFEQHLLDTLEAGHNSRRHLLLDADTCSMSAYPHCRLAARLQGSVGSSVTLYYINNESVSYAILPGGDSDHWLCGTSDGSISDLCTTPSVLSVGAYSAVDSLVNIFGRVHYPLAQRHQICAFSSYGHSWQGDSYPDVVCPGASVISSFSRYWSDKITYYYTSGRYLDSPMMYVVTPQTDGPNYYWIHSVGTSQSSPVMAGIIALWLEACPSLSVRQIREVLRQTSRFDDACLHAPGGSLQAGSGKADAVAGLQFILSQSDSPIIQVSSSVSHSNYDLFGRRLANGCSGLSISNGVKVWQR